MAEAKFLKFDTLAPACRPAARPGDRRARGADLPDDLLRVRRHRPRRRAVQPRARRATSIRASPTRPWRCSRSASRRSKAASARSRRRAARPRCILAIATLMGQGGHIVASASLYGGSVNLLQLTLPRFGITTSFVNPRDLAGFRAAIRPETRLRLRRDPRQSRARGARPRRRSPAIAHEAKLPLLIDSTFATPYLSRPFEHGADLRAAFGDQVAGRPWRRDRRRAGRRRPLRLGGVGQVPDPDRALCRLSRHRLRRGVRAAGLHHARARRGPARFRRLHEPGQRLLHPAGRRDPAAAHGAPRRQHATRCWRSSRPIPAVAWVNPSRAARASGPRAGQAPAAEGRGLDGQLRHQGRARGRAALHRGAASSPRISPMSATPRPWSSIRPAPRTSRWTPRRSPRPASART